MKNTFLGGSRVSAGRRKQRDRKRQLFIQRLETRRVLAGNPVITEFMASNSSGLQDGFAEDSDWIEIRNDADVVVDLNGYHLTDSASDLNKWEFTAPTPLAPGEYLVVFASGRDLIDPAGNQHTNFQLDGSGDYLALTAPDQAILSEFGDGGLDYPPQVTNLSYGVSGAEFVGPNSVADYLVPTDGTLGETWTSNSFDASVNGFSLGRAAIGYENSPGSSTSYSGHFLTEVPSGTTNVYQRVEFDVENAGAITDLQLSLNFDDGLRVYLNGVPVVNENVPSPLAFNTPASATHSDAQALEGNQYNLDSQIGLLVDGQNTLAIHALNRPNSSDFLMIPRLRTDSIEGDVGYLSSPTPGAGNAREIELGPFVSDVSASPAVPLQGENLTITASVADFTSPLDPTTVRMHYRVMYSGEVSVPMNDGGTGVDSVAGDGIFSAEIPSSSYSVGEMVRWRVTADDVSGIETREPRFLDALDSPEYFGTVVADSSITTDLPVMQWFLADPASASTTAGTRASLFTGGEFYDNISVNNHGQSTRGSAFPKKSFDFDANSGNKFRIRSDLGRVSDFNLLTNYADQTKLRNSLMYDLFAQADYAHHYAFSMMVYQNGAFYGLYDVVEEGDTEYLDRLGFDSDNPLYKVNNRLDNAYSNVEKKSREYEDHSDFQEVVDGAQTLTGSAAITWDFDHLDIADIVNYLAIHNVGVSSDFGHKNMYWYRDTNGTGLWAALPWDQDLSLGHQWDASISPPYFKDALITQLNIYRGANNIFQRLYNDPTFLEMYVRRVRTLSDQFYGVPGSTVTDSYLATNIDRLEALIADEAIQDMNQWGIQANFTRTPAEAADQLIDEFIPLRRAYLDAQTEVPSSQIGTPEIRFDDIDYDADPVSGLQAEEYVRLNNPNQFSVDISGWRLDGGIDHRFKGGTVIPAGGSLYVVKDVVAFQSRTTGPSSGANLFIQGNYQGQLSFTGEVVELIASDGTVVDTLETPLGNPTVNQQFLRVTEVQYNPVVDDTEFIEFANVSSGGVATSLDLSGVSIVDGPSQPYIFPGGTVLAPGERLLVVQDIDAMLAAYPALDGSAISGRYNGKLSNSGERIKVIDGGGETIVDLDYGDSDPWPISSDGAGATLVLSDPSGTSLARLSKPYSWQGSRLLGGTPGSGDSSRQGVVINELLTHSDPPQQDSIELFNPTDHSIAIGGWFLSDSKSDLLKYQIPDGTMLQPGGYIIFDESDFNPTPQDPGPSDFALNGSQGDEVFLVVADPTDSFVTEFVDEVTIGATLNGQTFGRLPNGVGRLAPLSEASLGSENAAHEVGDVVISEVHYHPAEPTPADLLIDPTLDSSDLEFIELHNHSEQVVNLADWRIRGDADFDFLAPAELQPGATLVLVSFDPGLPANLDRVAAFENHFGMPGTVALSGPFSGSLGNSYGRVELEHPDTAPADDPTVMPRVTLDEVLYDDLSPWPTDADGLGASLQRTSEFAYGNAFASWEAAVPTPGVTFYRPSVVDVQVNNGQAQRSVVTSATVTFDREVDLDGSSLEIRRREDNQLVDGLILESTVTNGQTSVTVTFPSGPLVQTRASGNSLVQGNYQLQVFASGIRSTFGGAEMRDDYRLGAAAQDAFFRQFGDLDGNRVVDSQDYGRFGESYLTATGASAFETAFDFDGDDDVDGLDFSQFRRQFMRTMNF